MAVETGGRLAEPPPWVSLYMRGLLAVTGAAIAGSVCLRKLSRRRDDMRVEKVREWRQAPHGCRNGKKLLDSLGQATGGYIGKR